MSIYIYVDIYLHIYIDIDTYSRYIDMDIDIY